MSARAVQQQADNIILTKMMKCVGILQHHNVVHVDTGRFVWGQAIRSVPCTIPQSNPVPQSCTSVTAWAIRNTLCHKGRSSRGSGGRGHGR